MREIRKVVVTGGLGAVGSAYVRALVPAGYDVKIVDVKRGARPRALGGLGDKWERTPKRVEKVLLGYDKIDPLENLESSVVDVPYERFDLASSNAGRRRVNPFEGADAAVLCAANIHIHEDACAKNHDIDRNSIDTALEAGADVIIYTSSVWRTMNLAGKGKLINPETDEDAPDTPYAQAKVKSVRHLRKRAKENPDRLFIFNDHGWYPRETMGAPPSNLSGKALQFWVAECEMQMHVLRQLRIRENPNFAEDIRKGKNLFGFNVVSQNFPPADIDPDFSYDLSASERLGIDHRFDVYKVLIYKDLSWRRIPVFMD